MPINGILIVMGGAESNYEIYRGLIEDPRQRAQGMELEGLMLDDFERSLLDPRTITLNLPSSEVMIPLATPVENHGWLNAKYYSGRLEQSTGSGSDVYYLNHLAGLSLTDQGAYFNALNTLFEAVAGRGAIAVDHVQEFDQITKRDLEFAARVGGFKLRDVLKREPPKHYQYANQIISADPQHVPGTNPDLFEIYEQAVAAGRIPSDSPIQAYQQLSPADIEYVWAYYSARFGELEEVDPVLPGFNESQFDEIMRGPEFLKMTYRSTEGNVINVCLLGDVRSCDWLNQAYYQAAYREYYEQGLVLSSPGIIAEDTNQARGSSLSTMGLARRIFEIGDLEPIFTFVCDEVSNTQVPRLTEISLNRSGQLVADYQFPRTHQLFHLYTVEN